MPSLEEFKSMTELKKKFGKRVRVRVCGLLIQDDAILLVKHRMENNKELWIPPGGGVQFGETLAEALVREMVEETGLYVSVSTFHSVHEYINDPLHAVELFFYVKPNGSGELTKGEDPELVNQLIEEVRFVTFEELRLMPAETKHGILQKIDGPNTLLNVTSGFKISL